MDMIDRGLFERVAKYMKPYFSGGVSDALIDKFSKKLGVQLPGSYKGFLKEFGAGGWGLFDVMGIEGDDFSSMVIETLKYRNLINISPMFVVISYRRTDDYEFLTCLDTSRMNNGECPVVKYDMLKNTITDYQPTFDDAFNDGVMSVFNLRIAPKLADNPEKNKRELPAGLGYKGCWMTVIGSNQEKILNSLKFKHLEKMDYKEGLELVKTTSGKVMVTADFENRNYVIFYGGDFSFDEQFLKRMSADLPEVYGYITHRVSEVHGFFKVVSGEVQRIYYRDEEQIISTGDPLPEEKKNKVKLPSDFEEANDKKKKWTKFDEKIILKLAETSSTVENGKYPYAPVVLCDID